MEADTGAHVKLLGLLRVEGSQGCARLFNYPVDAQQ